MVYRMLSRSGSIETVNERHKLRNLSLLLLILIAAASLSGCTRISRSAQQQPEPPPALKNISLFTFDPLVVSPLPLVAGQTATVSMQISNTGSAEGTYGAELIINANKVDNQAVFVAAGSSSQATFQTTFSIPGHYIIKIGPQTTEIDVAFNRVPTMLKLDSGNVDGCDSLAGSTGEPGNMIQMVEGNMLKLIAPPGGFELNSIEIFGFIKSSDYDFNHDPVVGGQGTWVYGWDIATIEPVNPNFTINIYDSRYNRLFTRDFDKNLFSYAPGWVKIETSPLQVAGDFYIELVTHNQPKLSGFGYGDYDYWHRYVVHTWYYQLCIGYENAIEVQSFVSQNGNAVPERYLTYNWLMRANGYQIQN